MGTVFTQKGRVIFFIALDSFRAVTFLTFLLLEKTSLKMLQKMVNVIADFGVLFKAIVTHTM